MEFPNAAILLSASPEVNLYKARCRRDRMRQTQRPRISEVGAFLPKTAVQVEV